MSQSDLSFVEKKLLFVAIALSTFMIVLDYSIANVAIPYIAGALSVSTEQGTYVITSFAVGSAIGLAMTGWLTRRVGEIKLMTLSILLFTLLSWVCGLSFDLNMLVIARFVQGLVSGPVIPLSQSLIIKQGSERSRARDLSIWTTIIITAPVVGPILGGYLADWHSWVWIFYINIPVGIFCALIIWILLHKADSKIEKVPSDIWGILLLSLGVMCLQIFLDKGQQWDWLNSPLIWILLIGSLLAFTYLILCEIWHKTPLLELKLFRIPSFTLSIFVLIISYAIYFGMIVTVPLWLQEYMGYNAEWAGFVVAFVGIGPILVSSFIPRLIKAIGNEKTLLLGFLIFAIGSFYAAFFTTQVDWQHIAFSRFLFGVGLALYFNPMIAMSVQDISREQLPSAAGLFHFMRAMVGGIGTSVFTTIWIRRSYYHHARVGEALTLFNPATPKVGGERSLEILNDSLNAQSAMLAINDTFYLMAWLFVGLVMILFLWSLHKKTRPL